MRNRDTPVKVIRYRPSDVSAKLVIRPAHPTADRLGRAGVPAVGLDQADDPIPRHGVVHHIQIARLEDVQRQLSARQQDGSAQRKDRDHLRQIERADIALGHHFSLA